MRQPPTYTSWKVACRSSEEAQALQQWLSSRIGLDRVVTDTVRVNLSGVEKVQTVPHRLGDYFATIRMLPDSQANPTAFRVVFQKRPEAGRFWKDLMVNILQEIEATPQKASIELDSKGDVEPSTLGRKDDDTSEMAILRYLREANERDPNSEEPDDRIHENGTVTQVEYRLLCSGAFYPAHFLGDWSHSDVARILLRWPVNLLIASRPYESQPQELALRFTVSAVAEKYGVVSRGYLPDSEIADDLAALLTVFCRRLITVSGRVRETYISPRPPGPFPPAPSVLLDYPGPVVTSLKKTHWRSRPIEFLYGLDGIGVKSYQVPMCGFDSTWIINVLAKLPGCKVAPALIRAARVYALAMELIEHHHEICYQLLISAVETMAGAVELNWKPETKDKLELTSSKALLSYAKKQELPDDLGQLLALEACKDYAWAGRKFKEFILENIQQDDLAKEDDLFSVPARFCPGPENLRRTLGVIYQARGGATHGGRDYPASAGIGPSHMIPVEVLDEILNEERLFPPVCWFERVVNNALCGYIRRQVFNT